MDLWRIAIEVINPSKDLRILVRDTLLARVLSHAVALLRLGGLLGA